RWLCVQGQQQIERSGTIRMVHAQGAATQSIAQALGRVQDIRLAQYRGHTTEQALLLLRHLLHVVAFAESRLVTVDVIDADTIRRRCERACKSLHRARADRRNDRRQLTILPAQGRGGMGHLHFIAAIDGSSRALFIIDAEDIAEIGRTMPEDRKILAYTLFQQTQHESFRKRHLGKFGKALLERMLDAAGFGDRASTLARLQGRIRRPSVEHRSVSSRWLFRQLLSGWGPSVGYPTQPSCADSPVHARTSEAPCRQAFQACRLSPARPVSCRARPRALRRYRVVSRAVHRPRSRHSNDSRPRRPPWRRGRPELMRGARSTTGRCRGFCQSAWDQPC